MRRFCLLLLTLAAVTAAAWWAVTAQGGAAQSAPSAAENTVAAPYPADWASRAARVAGLHLEPQAGDDAPPLPAAEEWTAGDTQPEIGDPAARKGGAVNIANAGPYPANFLAFGSPAPQFFHYNLFTMVEMPLAARHPQTGQSIPALAEAWAVRGNTVFFRLNTAARYSNGRPVRAGDFVLGALLRAECGSADHAALCTAAAALRVYDERTLALTWRNAPPPAADAPAAAAALLHAAEPGFYAEFGSDYRERYARRVPPTTGAYTVGRTERGRLIELKKVPHWWAQNLPYYRYTCNVDSVFHHFLTDEAQVWELFRRGGLDAVQTRHVAAWQRCCEEAAAEPSSGIICRRFDAEYPLPPYGIAFNTERLPDAALRRGLMHAMDMDKAVALLFRGEAARLTTFSSGYGTLSPADTPRDAYDPAAARAAFARAGYDTAGEDGILHRGADGARLSVRLCFTPSEKISTLVNILAESARACGAEIVPEPLPWQSCDRRIREGTHELCFWATMPAAPYPNYDILAGDTDAPFRLHDERLQKALAQYEQAGDNDARAAAVAAVDAAVYAAACWLPGWKENRVLIAHHRRLHFPDTPTCRFSVPAPYEVMEAHLYWVED